MPVSIKRVNIKEILKLEASIDTKLQGRDPLSPDLEAQLVQEIKVYSHAVKHYNHQHVDEKHINKYDPHDLLILADANHVAQSVKQNGFRGSRRAGMWASSTSTNHGSAKAIENISSRQITTRVEFGSKP